MATICNQCNGSLLTLGPEASLDSKNNSMAFQSPGALKINPTTCTQCGGRGYY